MGNRFSTLSLSDAALVNLRFFAATSLSLIIHTLVFYGANHYFKNRIQKFGSQGDEIFVSTLGNSSQSSSAAKIKKAKLFSHPFKIQGTPTNKEAPGANAIPEYPEEARQNGWEGIVRLQLLLDKKGQVEKVSLFSSSGHSILDQAALAAAAHWAFPMLSQNSVTIPVEFRLE